LDKKFPTVWEKMPENLRGGIFFDSHCTVKLCLCISTNEQAIDTAAGRSGPAAGRDLSNACNVIYNKRAKITAKTILCYTVGRIQSMLTDTYIK